MEQKELSPSPLLSIVPVVLAKGKTFWFEMNFSAALAIKREFGRDIIKDGLWTADQLADETDAEFLPRLAVTILRCAWDDTIIPADAIEEQKNLTVEEFCKYLRPSNYFLVMQAIMTTMYYSTATTAEPQDPPQPVPSSTLNGSGN